MHVCICHMLNSSRDTLLELEPTFASVLKQDYYFKKLAVATVLTVAAAEA